MPTLLMLLLVLVVVVVMVWWCCGGASSAKKPIGIRTEDRARLNVTFDTGVMCWLSPKNRLSDAKVQPDMQLLSVLLSFWRYFPFFFRFV